MRSVGIDLGTTNTVVASDGTIVQQGPGAEAAAVLPSVVAYPPNGAMLVGSSAKRRRGLLS